MALFTSNPDQITLDANGIVSSWSTVIPHAAGRGEGFIAEIENKIAEFEIPLVATKRKEVAVSATMNREFRLSLQVSSEFHHTFFSSRDFGKHIILSQIIVVAMHDRRTVKAPSHLYEREREAAAFSFINAAKEIAVKKIAEEAKQDSSKINMGMTKGLIDIV